MQFTIQLIGIFFLKREIRGKENNKNIIKKTSQGLPWWSSG